jgi:phage tail protein X
MSKEGLSVASGVVVMLAGILTVWSMTTRASIQDLAAAPTTTVAATTTTAPQTVEIPLPDLPGVPAEVQRVLYWSGKADAILYGDLNGIPPAVQRVLIEYQAPLMVPSDNSDGASQ